MQEPESRSSIHGHASKGRPLLCLLQRLFCGANADGVGGAICGNHMSKLGITFLILLRTTDCFLYLLYPSRKIEIFPLPFSHLPPKETLGRK